MAVLAYPPRLGPSTPIAIGSSPLGTRIEPTQMESSTMFDGSEQLADALGSTSESDRARPLETMRAHLEGSGSPAETAQALYRHRNTVLNHLRRFEELTGPDLSRPRDLATAVLAVRAAHRLGR